MSLPQQIKDAAGEGQLSPADRLADVEAWTLGAFDAAGSLNEVASSRELSLAITKLEEAQMWLARVSLPEAA